MTRGMGVLRSQLGFTLTELLVAMAILALVLGGILTIQQQGQMAYVMGSNRVEVQQNARVALELMVGELRAATTITAAGSPSDITFQTWHDDVNALETVRYQLSGSVLNRTVGETTTPLIGGVQSFAMTYCEVWNAVGNICTTAALPSSLNFPFNVNVIQIRLVTKPDETFAAGSAADQSATLESLVKPRFVNF